MFQCSISSRQKSSKNFEKKKSTEDHSYNDQYHGCEESVAPSSIALRRRLAV